MGKVKRPNTYSHNRQCVLIDIGNQPIEINPLCPRGLLLKVRAVLVWGIYFSLTLYMQPHRKSEVGGMILPQINPQCFKGCFTGNVP